MGWFSRVEQPLVARLSLAIWRAAAGDALRLDEADRTDFRSIHDCFTRALKPGARPIDDAPASSSAPATASSSPPAASPTRTLVQAKGFTYTLDDLLQDPDLASRCRDGHYVTIRLTSTMYHRFHAPDDGCVTTVCHVPGDTWNVNPPALARVPRLYCRNERVIIPIALAGVASPLVLVPVGAILVGSVHLHFARLGRRRASTAATAESAARRRSGAARSSATSITAPRSSCSPRPASSRFRAWPRGLRLRVGQPLLRHASDAGGVASSSRNAPTT